MGGRTWRRSLHGRALRSGGGQWFSKPLFWTSGINTTWERVRNANPDIPSSHTPFLGVDLFFYQVLQGILMLELENLDLTQHLHFISGETETRIREWGLLTDD